MPRKKHQMSRATTWEALVSSHFAYLVDEFHMKVISRDASTNWETSVTYGRDPVGVIIRESVEFDRVEIELVRLVDGRVPATPIFVHPDTPIDRGLFDHVLAIRAPEEQRVLGGLQGLDPDSVNRSLEFLGPGLKQWASDFLAGDTAVIDLIGDRIHQRVAANPEKVTINFPEGTPDVDIAAAVARAKNLDPRVPVEVRFYRRPVKK